VTDYSRTPMKVVDRLPSAFGERQARLWLDLSRYATALVSKPTRRAPQWRFAIYDQRVHQDKPIALHPEQIAGDELAPAIKTPWSHAFCGISRQLNSRPVQRKFKSRPTSRYGGQAILGPRSFARCHNTNGQVYSQDYYHSSPFANTNEVDKIPRRKAMSNANMTSMGEVDEAPRTFVQQAVLIAYKDGYKYFTKGVI